MSDEELTDDIYIRVNLLEQVVDKLMLVIARAATPKGQKLQ